MPTGMRRQRKDVTEWMGFNHDNSSETHHSPYIHIYMYLFFFIFFFSSFNFIHIYQNIQRYLTKNQKDLWQKEGVSQTVSVCLSVKTLHEHSVLYTVHILDSNLWPWFLQFLNTYSLHCQVYASCKSFD